MRSTASASAHSIDLASLCARLYAVSECGSSVTSDSEPALGSQNSSTRPTVCTTIIDRVSRSNASQIEPARKTVYQCVACAWQFDVVSEFDKDFVSRTLLRYRVGFQKKVGAKRHDKTRLRNLNLFLAAWPRTQPSGTWRKLARTISYA